MTEIGKRELQEMKEDMVATLADLTKKEVLLLTGVVQGLKMARQNAAEDTAGNEKSA